MDSPHGAERFVSVEARPEAIRVDLAKTALIVVDMQNAFASKGGMFDLLGRDVSAAGEVITTIKKLAEAARAAMVRIIYLTMSYAADMSDSGGPGSPNWYKELGLAAMNDNPVYKGKFLIRGSWDAEVVESLRPQPGDVVIQKSRYSGFRGTSLDVVLKTWGITYLIFTGIATNVCVESTVRDAFFLDYWPILISDATNNTGPAFTQQATLWNVEAVFGWVATSDDVLAALSEG
jgi:ureidoacrylate peracid hydrolase